MRLDGFTAIVTGGGGTLGNTLVRTLAQAGSDVVVVTRSSPQDEIVEEIRELGRRAIALHADVSNEASVERMVERAIETFGKVDLLVNNAGIGIRMPLEQVSFKDWERVVAVNLTGVFLCSMAVARGMITRRKGNIVNMAGASAHRSFPGGGAFGPSKAGMISRLEAFVDMLQRKKRSR